MTTTVLRSLRQPKPTGVGRDTASRSTHGRWPMLVTAQLVVTGIVLSVQGAGQALDGVAVTPIVCALLLLFGLPHGTLDLELLRRRDGRPGLLVLLVGYGMCAAAMFALWQWTPTVALLVFVAIAVEHFAEDWDAMNSRFFEYGTAVALIVTPALLHRPALAAIFETLTGTASAGALGDVMLLFTPVAGLLAVAGAGLLWQRGYRPRAVGLAAALVAEALLPPVIGFALFFCFVHSPQQLRQGISRVRRPTREAWLRIILPLTLAALGLAAAIGATALHVSLHASALRASFVTLSVLTLPHMVLPYAVRRFAPRGTVTEYARAR